MTGHDFESVKGLVKDRDFPGGHHMRSSRLRTIAAHAPLVRAKRASSAIACDRLKSASCARVCACVRFENGPDLGSPN